jgi:hypothetical protein
MELLELWPVGPLAAIVGQLWCAVLGRFDSLIRLSLIDSLLKIIVHSYSKSLFIHTVNHSVYVVFSESDILPFHTLFLSIGLSLLLSPSLPMQ